MRPTKIIKKIEKILQCNYTVFKKGSDPELLYEAYRTSFETGRKMDSSRQSLCLTCIRPESSNTWRKKVLTRIPL